MEGVRLSNGGWVTGVRSSEWGIGPVYGQTPDSRADYVTSEPALDYAASSVLLLATLDAGC